MSIAMANVTAARTVSSVFENGLASSRTHTQLVEWRSRGAIDRPSELSRRAARPKKVGPGKRQRRPGDGVGTVAVWGAASVRCEGAMLWQPGRDVFDGRLQMRTMLISTSSERQKSQTRGPRSRNSPDGVGKSGTEK
jgi:hypothetical protein